MKPLVIQTLCHEHSFRMLYVESLMSSVHNLWYVLSAFFRLCGYKIQSFKPWWKQNWMFAYP